MKWNRSGPVNTRCMYAGNPWGPACEVRMNRNYITILLLVCSLLLLLGGGVLYFTLNAVEPGQAGTAPFQIEQEAEPSIDPEGGILIEGGESGEEGNAAEIVPDDSDLDPAPDFLMTDRSGAAHHLSEYFGKPIIINFWATWCGPCQMELPYFEQAYAEYGDRICFLMVDLVDGSYETEESGKSFVDVMGYSFPLYFDAYGDGSMAYEIEAIPLTIVINANGRILETHLGSMSESELQELIDMALKG